MDGNYKHKLSAEHIETSLFLDDCNSMETDSEANKVPEGSHITHEYLVTTLATLCTSEENVKCIVPSLVDKLTTLSESMLFRYY